MNIPVIALGSLIVLQLIPWIIFSRKWNARIKQIYRAFFCADYMYFCDCCGVDDCIIQSMRSRSALHIFYTCCVARTIVTTRASSDYMDNLDTPRENNKNKQFKLDFSSVNKYTRYVLTCVILRAWAKSGDASVYSGSCYRFR